MKKAIIIILALCIAGAGAYLLLGKNTSSASYRTEKAIRADISSTVTATGTVTPVVTVLVGTQVSGTIKEISADFNSPVKKGQTLAVLDPSILEAQVAQASAGVLVSKSNSERAEAELKDALRVFELNREFFAKGLISKNELDALETKYLSAVAQASAAKAQISQAQAQLKTAEINLMHANITSPIDGTVISRSVDKGQTVAASFQTPTLFTIAQDLTNMQIHSNVVEADIGRVLEGMPVEFTVDAYPEYLFKGDVLEVRLSPQTVQNVVTYDVVIGVDNKDLKLKPGMTANISIIIEKKKDALLVPNSALRFSPDTDGIGADSRKGKAVHVLLGKELKRVPIETGISDGTNTEVLSGDISEGNDIVLEMKGKLRQQNSQPRGFRMF